MLILSLFHRLHLVRLALRRHFVAATGVQLGENVVIGSQCEITLGLDYSRRGHIEIGAHTRLESGVLLHPFGGHIRIGRDVFIGPDVAVYGHGDVHIGDDCLIAMHCRILSSNHTIPDLGCHMRTKPDILAPTRIGRDVWLGAGVTVLAGVTIGDGCVVGAGAVITRDLPPGSIAAGIPARILRQR